MADRHQVDAPDTFEIADLLDDLHRDLHADVALALRRNGVQPVDDRVGKIDAGT